MTLGNLILRKYSEESLKYPSPPPEEQLEKVIKKKYVNKFSHIKPRIDTKPPNLDPFFEYRKIEEKEQKIIMISKQNMNLLNRIRNEQLFGGRVDSHWKVYPKGTILYYKRRKDFVNYIIKSNKKMYNNIIRSVPKVVTTKKHLKDWKHNRHTMIKLSKMPFVLFPEVEEDVCEDLVFRPAHGVKRQRVHLEFKIKNWHSLGMLEIELFDDICPKTCALFIELLLGDNNGYGYIGTSIFRRVDSLYWCAGDVVYDNGFGCYAQKGRRFPIGAENYHLSHTMPGLLSMRVTSDNEVCGIFNITFKSLQQLDLHNVVFGRIIRPSTTWDKMTNLPPNVKNIILSSCKFFVNGKKNEGVKNTKIDYVNSCYARDYLKNN